MRVSRHNPEIPTLDTSGGHSDSNARLAHPFGNPTGSFRQRDSGLQAVHLARKRVLQTACGIGMGGFEKSAPGNYEMTSQCLSVTSSPRRFRVLLLVPALILTAVYAAVKLASGPYFLSANFDPDYVYLFNALNIAVGLAPVHTDHPASH